MTVSIFWCFFSFLEYRSSGSPPPPVLCHERLAQRPLPPPPQRLLQRYFSPHRVVCSWPWDELWWLQDRNSGMQTNLTHGGPKIEAHAALELPAPKPKGKAARPQCHQNDDVHIPSVP